MSKIDELIHQSLSREDEELLEAYDHEPGYLQQAFGVFRGRLGWVMWVAGISQALFFLLGVYALYQMLTGAEVLIALRWGIGAVVLVQLSTFLRGFMGTHFEANRVLRQLKRLELRLVRMETSSDA